MIIVSQTLKQDHRWIYSAFHPRFLPLTSSSCVSIFNYNISPPTHKFRSYLIYHFFFSFRVSNGRHSPLPYTSVDVVQVIIMLLLLDPRAYTLLGNIHPFVFGLVSFFFLIVGHTWKFRATGTETTGGWRRTHVTLSCQSILYLLHPPLLAHRFT